MGRRRLEHASNAAMPPALSKPTLQQRIFHWGIVQSDLVKLNMLHVRHKGEPVALPFLISVSVLYQLPLS
jgi:hypothetical protein